MSSPGADRTMQTSKCDGDWRWGHGMMFPPQHLLLLSQLFIPPSDWLNWESPRGSEDREDRSLVCILILNRNWPNVENLQVQTGRICFFMNQSRRHSCYQHRVWFFTCVAEGRHRCRFLLISSSVPNRRSRDSSFLCQHSSKTSDGSSQIPDELWK